MAAAGNPEHRCAARGVGFAPTDEGQKIPFGSFGHTGVATSLVWRGAPTHTSAVRSEPLPLPRGIDLAAGVSVLVQAGSGNTQTKKWRLDRFLNTG